MRSIFIKTVFSFVIISFSQFSWCQGVYQVWGTTGRGGSFSNGNIFSVEAENGRFSNRYSFILQNDGRSIESHVKMVEWNGKLYGTFSDAGIYGDGVIFEFDPVANLYTKKYDFHGENGARPRSLVLLNGKFYGTTLDGGTNDRGVIFEWDPATNIYTRKFDFVQATGVGFAEITELNGKFYGITDLGGANGVGVIFEWDPITNIYTKKIDFGSVDGKNPFGGLILKDGKFYGRAGGGGVNNKGVLYEWDPVTNTYTKKIDLVESSGNSEPGRLVLLNNKFFGLTPRGGSSTAGTLFEWDPVANIYTKRFDFDFINGDSPMSDLESVNGKLYGVTYKGGAFNHGIIFEYDPAGPTFTKKFDLAVATGSNCQSPFTLFNGKLYSVAWFGGPEYEGLIFEWDPLTNIYTRRIDMNLDNGLHPTSELIPLNGSIYGITSRGGTANFGTLYEWSTASSQITNQIDMGTANGSIPLESQETDHTVRFPQSMLLHNDGKIYGFTIIGGAAQQGAIFEWNPGTNVLTKKFEFPSVINSGGGQIYHDFGTSGGLVSFNNKIIGITNVKGTKGLGYLFEWDPATNAYSHEHNFDSAGGAVPNRELTVFNGKIYGTTLGGGANNVGAIFEWDPLTNGYLVKFSFPGGVDGYSPLAGLVMLNNKFYGSTWEGGANNVGVLFEWDPVTGIYSKKRDMTLGEGSRPFGKMAAVGNRLFGLTDEGGDLDEGVVFEWRPLADSFTVLHHFNGVDGGLSDGEEPSEYSELSVVPAPVAKGIPNTCTSTSPAVVAPVNSHEWLAFTDQNGDVVAEIKANGNDLGLVTCQFYINSGPVRETDQHQLYLDRNLVITPQRQPTTPVDVRIYISEAEFQALKNATNSLGQPSGITTANNLAIFKSSGNSCTNGLQVGAGNIPVTVEVYGGGYVLIASISSFSNFYVANNTFSVLPLTLFEFKGRLTGLDAELEWKTENESGVGKFFIERSLNGKDFNVVGTISATNNQSGSMYSFTDKQAGSFQQSGIYYRLRLTDLDGKAVYSRIVMLETGTRSASIARVYPNPAGKELGVLINLQKLQNLNWTITDMNGRILGRSTQTLLSGNNNFSIPLPDLPKGIYFLTLRGNDFHKELKFIEE